MQQNVHPADKTHSGKPCPVDESKTLTRGLALMDAILAGPEEGLRVVSLCRQTGLERATVYRLLAALQEANYVRLVSRFHYGPGPRWNALAQPKQLREDLTVQLKAVLAQVSKSCGDAAFAVVRDGGLSHCIARQVGVHPVQVLEIQVGTRQPLGVGAAGLALLSALSDRDVTAVIDLNEAAFPLYRGMTPERLRMMVTAARERGWAVIGNHVTHGVLAVGMPVYDKAGDAIAGISVATTEERMPKDRQRQIVRFIRQALRSNGFTAY